ncbi:MAG TPA: hypothetical protein VI456_02050 [Polyangia bacterium]
MSKVDGLRDAWMAGVLAVLACAAAGCGQQSLGPGALTDGGGSCGDAFAPPTPQPMMPNAPGCYETVDGGWIPVLCLCQVPVDNASASPETFTIALAMTKSSPVPSFDGSFDVAVSFDDPDASWYRVWAAQSTDGTDYAVTNVGGETTVELGLSSLVLAPVPLSACGARLATATISGTYAPSWAGMTLSIAVSADAGHGNATGTCPAPVPL